MGEYSERELALPASVATSARQPAVEDLDI